MKRIVLAFITLLQVSYAVAQFAPTGAHYGGRPSDTGHGGTVVSAVGGYAASIPLDMPADRAGLPIPVQIVYGGMRAGAAGLGWDVPLSYLQQRRTFAHRRPSYVPNALPQPRQRTMIALLGRDAELMTRGNAWVARGGTLELSVRQSGGTWTADDGSGRRYTFVQPPQLANSGLWLLKSITAAGGAVVELTYQLNSGPVGGGSGIEINLQRVTYNRHPGVGCSKHHIELTYGVPAAEALALTMIGETALVRYRTLTYVDVMSRATCNTILQRLRRYELTYAPDPDTKLPRLQGARVFGRQGTLEEQLAIPIATYEYGSATRDGKLQYEQSQIINLPPENDGTKIAGTVVDSSVVAPGPGEKYASWQSLTDITGDGRPDLVLKKNGKLWVGHNFPAPDGKTAIATGQGVMPLHDATFQNGAFSTHTVRTRRFKYSAVNGDAASVSPLGLGTFVAANHNTVDVWRQAIDINGDGRIDIIDAAEQPMKWTIYLNTPGGNTSGVKWKKTSFSIKRLHTELTQRGHTIGDRLPLSRRATSGSVKLSTCWRWQNGKWNWFNGWGQVCFGDPTRVLDREPERTLVEWELSDLNGDGYPDFVFNSTPVKFQLLPPDPPSQGEDYFRYGDVWVPFAPAEANAVRAAYNIVGVRFDYDEPNPFARSVTLQVEAPRSGVAVWAEAQTDTQRQVVGQADVNGDGLLDRIVNKRAYLGVFIGTARAFSSMYLTLPGVLSIQESERTDDCKTKPRFTSRITAGFRDLTGDGVPDYYSRGTIAIGTGAGFAGPVPVTSPLHFVFSHQTEACDGDVSNTDGGLYDIDGDGQPEVLGVINNNGTRAYVVSQLKGGTTPRTPQAGRLTAIDNGFGANTRIKYLSAKEDRFATHQVPFPEIVVSAVETIGAHDLGGRLAGMRYAYGHPQMMFDGALDAFTFSGYRRSVEMYPYGGDREEAFAVITDTWPLSSYVQAATKQQRWARNVKVGRVQDVYTLRGSGTTDPWSLLGITPSDTRVIGVTHQDWNAKFYEEAAAAPTNWRDCLEMAEPYDLVMSLGVNKLDTCRSHGFAFVTTTESWYGGSPPPSSNNIQTRSELLEVDDFGRVLFVRYDGDRFRSGDDGCVEMTFAAPAGAGPRVLTAPATRRVTDCARRITYASEEWRYDGLAAGLVSNGRVTAHTVDRRATDNGALLQKIRKFDATYDAAGSLRTVITERAGASRASQHDYDPFGIVAVKTTLNATGVPTMVSAVNVDPVTLEPIETIDANGTKRGAEFDGYGRIVRTTVTPPGGQSGVVSTIEYQGFDGSDPAGRRIVVKEFLDPPPATSVSSAPGLVVTTYLDELGRERRSEAPLGADYGGEALVLGARIYDELGRVSFAADPYPRSESVDTAFGTTYHYKRDGDLNCVIRGRGRQPLTPITNMATETFPTCLQRSFENHVDTLEVRDAVSLQAGSPQAGVVHRTVSSAIGNPIERATVKAGVRLDHVTFEQDRLGQNRTMTRYLDPIGAANPVRWAWRIDSLGQMIKLEEPDTAPRTHTYSAWGELLETRWMDGATDRRLVQTFDALGRLTRTHEASSGTVDPESVKEFSYDAGSSPSPMITPTNVLGRLAQASTAAGKVSYSYDYDGRTIARVFTDSQNGLYVEKSQYHGSGALASLEFNLPDTNFAREIVKYAYDSAERLRAISYSSPSGDMNVYQAEGIDPLGRVRKSIHGGTTMYSAKYADGGRRLLKQSIVESPHGARQRIFLGYDAIGRELSRREIANGAPDGPKTNIAYDALGRLTRAITSNGPQIVADREFTYDALGNLLALNDAIGNTGATLTQSTDDRDRLCNVTYAGGSPGPGCNVVHDALGRVVTQPTRNGSRQISYFASGAVRTIDEQGVQARFKYDPFGQVQELDVQGTSPQVNRQDRRYGGVFERREVSSGGGSSAVLTRHIPGPAGIVASRRGVGSDWIFEFGEGRGNRYFTNQQGVFVQTVDYQAFGEATSTGAAAGSAGYTSYQWNQGDTLAPFGLSHLGARLYDPVIGRFLSRDPVMVARGAVTSNPYAFAFNDPLNFSDPTGLQPEENDPLIPLNPFGSAGGSSSGGCSHGPCSKPSPAPPPPAVSGGASSGPVPVVGAEIRENVLILKGLVNQGDITTGEASKSFRNFIKTQVHTNQLSLGGAGWCACATRQIALKHAGVIRLGLSYGAIKTGLSTESSSRAGPGDWEAYHFNWTDQGKFITSGRLNPEAIAQIARNPAVGTGSTTTMHWEKLTAAEARQFLNEGAMIAVTTGGHWMTAVRDPLLNKTLILDPMADLHSYGPVTEAIGFMEHPYWGSVIAYFGLVQD